MNDQNEPGDITRLIRASAEGDQEAKRQLVENVYEDLRRLAGHLMGAERRSHTLQPTALVNEFLMQVWSREAVLGAKDKQHLLSTAARAMRHLLVDYARGKRAGKRGAGIDALGLRPEFERVVVSDEKLITIHDSLNTLAERDERQAQVVEMKIFGGFTVAEIAESLGVTTRTVERDWTFAKAWLQKQLR